MNKDINPEQFVRKLDSLKLSTKSRARMEKNLREYAQFHPVRVAEAGRSIEQVPQRTSLLTYITNLNTKSMTAAFIAIALMVGGGTSYAAEGAVPGDLLYPVKTEVNENVKSALAVSNASEARLQVQLAEERLAEAQELAARGELTTEASTNLSARLKNHAEKAQARSDAAEAAGDFESNATVRASLEGSLRTYAAVLADLNTRVTGNNGTTLITDIRTYADAAAAAQSKATATIDVSTDARADVAATVNQADTFLTDVEAKVSRAKARLSANAAAQLDAKLTTALNAQAKAEAALTAETYQAAYTAAQTAMKTAAEVEALLNSQLRLQVGGSAETVLDGVLQGTVNTAAEAETDTDREATEQTTTEAPTESESESETETEAEAEANVDVEVDTSVDTDAINAEVGADAGLSGGLRATDYNSSRSNKSY